MDMTLLVHLLAANRMAPGNQGSAPEVRLTSLFDSRYSLHANWGAPPVIREGRNQRGAGGR